MQQQQQLQPQQQEWRPQPVAEEYAREDPTAKRPRYDSYNTGNGYVAPSRPEMSYEDRTNPQPSPVVHIRNLSELCTEEQLIDSLTKMAYAIRCVIMMPRKGQALVELVDVNDATRLVKNQGLKILGMDTQINYSTSLKIHRPPTEEMKPNKILLMTVVNPRYPIDVDVIHKITSPHGPVVRIVIFRKHGGVQAMVEFDSIETAVRAKSYLNGADIYSGCCTLKIEFAKTDCLQVTRNDKDTWDYTRETLPEPNRPPPLLEKPADMPQSSAYGDPYGGGRGDYQQPPAYDPRAVYGGDQRPPHQQGYDYQQRPPVGGAPPNGAPPSYSRSQSYDRRSPPSSYAQSGGDQRSRDYDRNAPPSGRDIPPQYNAYGSRNDRDSYQSSSGHRDERGGGGYGDSRRFDDGHRGGGGPNTGSSYGGGPEGDRGGMGGSVAMLYGLSEKINCDRLFNLFCLYGNIVRIKFLKTKEGSAMIQMGDSLSMRRAIENLHGLTLFGKKIQVTESRQATINEVPNPYMLGDNSLSYKDYSGSRNNRFATPEQAAKNRITPPTRCLHFFNAPAGADEAEVEEVFTRNGGRKPDELNIMHGKSERSVSGFVSWATLEQAVEALILVNHTELPNKSTAKGAFPYIFKVCFTQPNANRERGSFGGGRGGGGEGGEGGRNGSGGEGRGEKRAFEGGGGGRGGRRP